MTATLAAARRCRGLLGERCPRAGHLPRRVSAPAARPRRAAAPAGRRDVAARRHRSRRPGTDLDRATDVRSRQHPRRRAPVGVAARRQLKETRRVQASINVTRAARVTVSVETRSGVRVATIARRSVQPGRLLVQWDGTTPSSTARGGRALVYGGFYVVRFSRQRTRLGTVELGRKPVFVTRAPIPKKPKPPKKTLPPVGSADAARLRHGRFHAGSLDPERPHRPVDDADRGLRALRGLLPDADRRRPTGGERAGDGLRRRGGRCLPRARQEIVLFGESLGSGWEAYLAVALAGTIGYTIGSILGWWIGRRAGRPFLERHGRWLHLNPAKLDRAERWFDRWGDWGVFLGRITELCAPSSRSRPVSSERSSGATRC